MLDPKKLRVRPATEPDLEQILNLYAQSEFDAGHVLPLAAAKHVFERFADYPDYTLYVAEQDGEIVGTFALLVMHNLGHLGAPSGIVEDVAVAPARQGHGIGKAMMQFALSLCRDKGCYKLTLSSNAKRERAHGFYESLGFERHGFSFRVHIARGAP